MWIFWTSKNRTTYKCLNTDLVWFSDTRCLVQTVSVNSKVTCQLAKIWTHEHSYFGQVWFSYKFGFWTLTVIVTDINGFQAVSDLRQARRRHAVEMQHMARRPFASQSVVLEYHNPCMLEPYRQLTKFSSSKADLNMAHKKSHQVIVWISVSQPLGFWNLGHTKIERLKLWLHLPYFGHFYAITVNIRNPNVRILDIRWVVKQFGFRTCLKTKQNCSKPVSNRFQLVWNQFQNGFVWFSDFSDKPNDFKLNEN